MDCKSFAKPGVLIPVIVGIIIGAGLFFLGEADDAPGLCLTGLVLGSALIFFGIFGVKRIREKIDPGIAAPLFYCVSGIILGIVLEFDGEISAIQRIIIISAMIGMALISIGTVMLIRRMRTKLKS